MKFIVEPAIFEKLPAMCIGIVVARDIDNRRQSAVIERLLSDAAAQAEARFAGKKVKEDGAILPYREAFQHLGINPNKFMCSIEALFTRIAKGKGMPSINPLVDLNNAISLKYTLPMGTHDLAQCPQDIMLRFSRPGDSFIPFGGTESEAPEEGEAVYAVGGQVRTRRWTWRQSEIGKIGADTDYVFFPIDGFIGFNDGQVRAATAELAALLQSEFNAEVNSGFIDRRQPEMDLTL